jgi:hypothetical protein
MQIALKKGIKLSDVTWKHCFMDFVMGVLG